MLQLTRNTRHVPVRQKPVRQSHTKNQLVLNVQKMFVLSLGGGVKVAIPIETRRIRVSRTRAGAIMRRADLRGYVSADVLADDEHIMNVEDCARW